MSHRNPKYTPEEEAKLIIAEAKGTRATILELGCGEFLTKQTPCSDDLPVITEALQEAGKLRKACQAVHAAIRTNHAPKTARKGATK